MKNKIKLFSIVLLIFVCIFCISGCQSTNKRDSYFNYSMFEQASFEYDEETLRERFDDLDTEEEFERAARIMLFGENMNEYEPNDI